MAKIKLYMAIPTMGTIVDSQVHRLREIEDIYKDKIEFIYPLHCVRRVFHDFARNAMVEDFLSSDADVLWFLDSDITPPKYVLDLLVVHGNKWKVGGLTYPVFMRPAGSDQVEVVYTTYMKNPDTGNFTLSSVPKYGEDFVDGLATGCLFINREVLEKLSPPYFEFKFKEDTREMQEGEDLGFCRKVHALGYKFFVDFGMTCKHEKTVCLFDVNNYAISYSNRNVMGYDARIKEQITDAIRAAYAQGANDAKKKSRIHVPTNWSLPSNIR